PVTVGGGVGRRGKVAARATLVGIIDEEVELVLGVRLPRQPERLGLVVLELVSATRQVLGVQPGVRRRVIVDARRVVAIAPHAGRDEVPQLVLYDRTADRRRGVPDVGDPI